MAFSRREHKGVATNQALSARVSGQRTTGFVADGVPATGIGGGPIDTRAQAEVPSARRTGAPRAVCPKRAANECEASRRSPFVARTCGRPRSGGRRPAPRALSGADAAPRGERRGSVNLPFAPASERRTAALACLPAPECARRLALTVGAGPCPPG